MTGASATGEWAATVARIRARMLASRIGEAELSVATGYPARLLRSWLALEEMPPADALAPVIRAVGGSADEILGMGGGDDGR